MNKRIDVTDVPYHVFARGNNKQAIFFDEFDRVVFLKYIREAKRRFDLHLFTYSLMTNHFHLLLRMVNNSSLSKFMHFVLFQYSRYINRKYDRVGHLFQGRFHSLLVETDSYFLTVDRYIHLNPVKAGLVTKPEDFPWSSYRARFHPLTADWIDHETALSYFGSNQNDQWRGYRKFTDEGVPKPEEWDLDMLRKKEYHGSLKFYQQILSRISPKIPA